MPTTMTRQAPVDCPYINVCGSGSFKVSGSTMSGAVLLLPDRVLSLAAVSVADIDQTRLQPVFEMVPPVEMLLIGTGDRFVLIPHELRQALKAAGISVESMATRSACLTYNLVAGEGRRVAAALLPIS